MDDSTDLEALFDEISAQRATPEPVSESSAGAAAVAAPDQDSSPPASNGGMFERLGGIVRLLHDSLRELGYDRSLSDMASQIGDAQNRLEHVATLTEQAATKVLNTIDAAIPQQDALASRAREIESRWVQMHAGRLSIDEFKALANDSQQFAAATVLAAESEKARLLDMMMAQDFQDITGQLIKKIVAITHAAEKELAQLLRDNAPPEVKQACAARQADLMQGPAVKGVAMAQTDVDQLLGDLGF